MLLSKFSLCLVVLTSSTFFILGAYYQHDDVLRNLQQLIQNDPYAFYIRRKLYKTLQLFDFNAEVIEARNATSRMPQIMKYGFPGLDDIRVYADFILSYDRRNRVAHWVYEHLRAPCVGNTFAVNRRESHYQPDMSVPSNFRSDLADYYGSGFDRGHLAAAGNHKCSQTHCNETFYLTNIAPQVGKGFNRDAWNNLERYVRELTERYGSVYVCTGPVYLPKRQQNSTIAADGQRGKDSAEKWCVEYEVIGQNTVAVPTHFFKVITVESKLNGGRPYMEAYMMPNAPLKSDVDIRTFLTDIRVIEHAAGLQFFDGLRRSSFFGTNYPSVPELYRNFE